jgi:hypothetical protein
MYSLSLACSVFVVVLTTVVTQDARVRVYNDIVDDHLTIEISRTMLAVLLISSLYNMASTLLIPKSVNQNGITTFLNLFESTINGLL